MQLNSMMIRVKFPIVYGNSIDTDHAESLYSAISSLVPTLHQQERLAISPIWAEQAKGNRLHVNRQSHFFLQCPPELIQQVLPLAGQALKLRNDRIRIGVPQLMMIRPSSSLVSRMVVMRNAVDEEKIQSNVKDKLQEMFENQVHDLNIQTTKRRILRIHQRKIIGFGIRISGLTEEQSVMLQSNPIGGRSRYGCGIFIPAGV